MAEPSGLIYNVAGSVEYSCMPAPAPLPPVPYNVSFFDRKQLLPIRSLISPVEFSFMWIFWLKKTPRVFQLAIGHTAVEEPAPSRQVTNTSASATRDIRTSWTSASSPASTPVRISQPRDDDSRFDPMQTSTPDFTFSLMSVLLFYAKVLLAPTVPSLESRLQTQLPPQAPVTVMVSLNLMCSPLWHSETFSAPVPFLTFCSQGKMMSKPFTATYNCRSFP